MKSKQYLSAVLLAALLMSCSTTKIQQGFYSYKFDVDGQEYQIISATSTGNGKYNLLVHENDKKLQFRAVDYEQDGRLDSIIVGNVSLDEANSIYETGISTAEAKGNLNRQEYPRLFELDEPMKRYRVQTFMKNDNEVYNRFTVLNLYTLDQDVILDKNADGILDKIESGSKELSEYQKQYEMTLTKGVQIGKIQHKELVYTVAK